MKYYRRKNEIYLRRKLMDLHIPKPIISELVNGKGLLNLLTVVPINEIENRAIAYIRKHFNEQSCTFFGIISSTIG
jgi:hypothetical protein